jgi:hypothetical protein
MAGRDGLDIRLASTETFIEEIRRAGRRLSPLARRRVTSSPTERPASWPHRIRPATNTTERFAEGGLSFRLRIGSVMSGRLFPEESLSVVPFRLGTPYSCGSRIGALDHPLAPVTFLVSRRRRVAISGSRLSQAESDCGGLARRGQAGGFPCL